MEAPIVLARFLVAVFVIFAILSWIAAKEIYHLPVAAYKYATGPNSKIAYNKFVLNWPTHPRSSAKKSMTVK